MNTVTMSDHLATLQPPTTEATTSLAERMMTNDGIPLTFERSRHYLGGTWPYYAKEKQREFRDAFNEQRDRYVENARAILTREYERELAGKRHVESEQQKALDALTTELRAGYLASPGATLEGFTAALPELLEARRRDAALNATRDRDAAIAKARASGRFSL